MSNHYTTTTATELHPYSQNNLSGHSGLLEASDCYCPQGGFCEEMLLGTCDKTFFFHFCFFQKLFPGLTFDLLPGDFLRSLIKLGLCANPISEKVCYDFMELVIGMDSKNIDEVCWETI